MDDEFESKYGLCSFCVELHYGLVREFNADRTRLKLLAVT